MGKVYIYVVDRDFGFAPNPFHGFCSLATCKPGIRNRAQINDWVIGMGGIRLSATGRCVYAMRVTAKISFNEYWENPEYLDKKPVRNGSRRMLVGDNVYHRPLGKVWQQADSHHSNSDGTINEHNLKVDTKSDSVLISRNFYYWGSSAPEVPKTLLISIGYKNGRNYRVFEKKTGSILIDWIENSFQDSLNVVAADPFDFARSEKRYTVKGNKVL